MNVDQFSSCQKKAWRQLQGSENIFLTGEAGSGKSYLVRHFMRHQNPKTLPILASTGAAAILVGGRTFHSFMGLGIMGGGVETVVKKALGNRRVVRRLQKIEGFVLDEVSMISGAALVAAEKICRLARGRKIEPWGGLRIIAVGDFFQLPPVAENQREWAFQEPIWAQSRFHPIVLEQNMRTKHNEFVKILNEVRLGKLTEQVESFLNSRLRQLDDNFQGTRLFPRRFQTEEYNLSRLMALEGEIFEFPSDYSGDEKFVETLKKSSPLPKVLKLKKNCLVMLRNNDPHRRWVNGSLGWVRKIDSDGIEVKLISGPQVEVEKTDFSLLNPEGFPIATVENFPLSLAYASTIHKAQGMTIDRVIVDMESLWEPGHAYVALSRGVNPQQIWLQNWSRRSIKADSQVIEYYKTLTQ